MVGCVAVELGCQLDFPVGLACGGIGIDEQDRGVLGVDLGVAASQVCHSICKGNLTRTLVIGLHLGGGRSQLINVHGAIPIAGVLENTALRNAAGQSPFVLVLSLLCAIPSLHNGVGGAVNLGSVRIIQSDGVSLIRTAGDILVAQINIGNADILRVALLLGQHTDHGRSDFIPLSRSFSSDNFVIVILVLDKHSCIVVEIGATHIVLFLIRSSCIELGTTANTAVNGGTACIIEVLVTGHIGLRRVGGNEGQSINVLGYIIRSQLIGIACKVLAIQCLIIPVVLLNVNNLIGAIRKNQTGLVVFGTNRIAVADLNNQCHVRGTRCHGIHCINIAIYQNQFSGSVQLRGSDTRVHGVPGAVDHDFVRTLGGSNFPFHNGCLLNTALAVSIIAALGDQRVISLLQAIADNIVIIRVLRASGDIVRANIGDFLNLEGGNLQDRVIGCAIDCQQLNLGTLAIGSISFAICCQPGLDVV